jgi:uncharacterized protein YggE
MALVALATPAAAQVAPGGSAGITVVGRAQQVVQADTIAFSAYVQMGAGSDPLATGDAIVSALKKDGVSDATWTASSFSRNGQSLQISGSVAALPLPDGEKIVKDVNAVSGTSAVQNLQILLQLRACSGIQEALRKRAIDDAHAQALKTASELGVRLGPPLNVIGSPALSSGCAQSAAPMMGPNVFGAGPINANGTIAVSQTVTITYAIAK